MPSILGFLSAACLVIGIGSCALARGAIQETASFGWFVLSAILFVGNAVVEEIRELRNEIKERAEGRTK